MENHPKTALVFLSEGFEEMETVAPIDLMRRTGVEVTVAACGKSLEVTGRSGIRICADILLDTLEKRDFDCLVVPGGPGCSALAENEMVLERIREQASAGRLIGAICAAPTVLARAGVLEGKAFTAHFSVHEKLPQLLPDRLVVVDGFVITSRGAGTATDFALALIAHLEGEVTARVVARNICWPHKLDCRPGPA